MKDGDGDRNEDEDEEKERSEVSWRSLLKQK